MQTTVNVVQPAATHIQLNYDAKCAEAGKYESYGGSNVEFGRRSKTVINKKDQYGFRPMSPYKAEYHKRIEPVGTSKMIGPTCWMNHDFSGFPGGMEWWFRDSFDRMTALGEQSSDLLAMRAEANLKQQDINLLLFAAFLPKTLLSIKDRYQKMDSLLDIAHDKKKLMRRFKKSDWKSLYLEWLFVWNQLHRDVVGGAAFLKKQSRPIGSLVTGRARAEWTTSYEDVKYPYAWNYIGKAVCRTDVHVSQRAVSVARVTCDVAYTHNALGIDNPVYLAWDLIRWSWVIDQVIDIGLFIQSITSLHGLEFLGTSITRRAVNLSQVNVEDHSADQYKFVPSYSTGTSIRKTVDREVRSNPTRTVTVRNPFQNSVAVTAAVAAAVGLKMQRDVDIDWILRHAR